MIFRLFCSSRRGLQNGQKIGFLLALLTVLQRFLDSNRIRRSLSCAVHRRRRAFKVYLKGSDGRIVV